MWLNGVMFSRQLSQLISKSTHHKPQSGGCFCRDLHTGNRHILQEDVIMQGQNYALEHWLYQTSKTPSGFKAISQLRTGTAKY